MRSILNKIITVIMILVLTGCSFQAPYIESDSTPADTTALINGQGEATTGEMELTSDNNSMAAKTEERNDKSGIWSPDGKWVAITTTARTWIDTTILDTAQNKEYETGVFRFVTDNAEKYDYEIGNNQRPDPYVNLVEWSTDSKKVLLSFSFTDDYFTRQTGVAVFNLENMAIDWMLKLFPAEGEHAAISKPEGFNWEAEDYGISVGLISKELLNGEGVYDRQRLNTAANRFVEALNNSEVQLLKEFTDPESAERFSDDCLKAAINDYKEYFRGQKIVRCEFAGIHPYAQQMAIYRLFNGDGRYKDVEFYYDSNKHYQCTDEFIFYSEYARKLVDSFFSALVKRGCCCFEVCSFRG